MTRRSSRSIALAAVVLLAIGALRLSRSKSPSEPRVTPAIEAAGQAPSRLSWEPPHTRHPYLERVGPLTHVDARRRAELLAQLLTMMQVDASTSTDTHAPLPQGTAGVRPSSRRTADDFNLAVRFIQEQIRHDFVPMAKGCYQDFLRRKPEAEGDVVVGFEIVWDESLGGVVNSAEIRDESTLRDESLETCLRESFLWIYFDPLPGGGVATIRFPFHFANGDVDGSHQLNLRDRRNESPPAATR